MLTGTGLPGIDELGGRVSVDEVTGGDDTPSGKK